MPAAGNTTKSPRGRARTDAAITISITGNSAIIWASAPAPGAKLSDPRRALIERRRKLSLPDAYLRAATRKPPRFIAASRMLDPEELPLEFLLGALRLEEGCPRRWFAERTPASDAMLERRLSNLRHRHLWDPDPARLRLTPNGRRFLNEALGEFLPDDATNIAISNL